MIETHRSITQDTDTTLSNPAGTVEFVDFELEDLLAGLFPGSSSGGLLECCSSRGYTPFP
jgi:hypothetical protein